MKNDIYLSIIFIPLETVEPWLYFNLFYLAKERNQLANLAKYIKFILNHSKF